ncbi:Mu transposase C-terminal domain-containing protein [Bradyrhizobium zhanjiangense]|uniref:Mu transposase C-terminal domain-containing protein n=1 Tax=Bradyrhizobium zhanjiangense TaxID=1325107 RepID=UPI001008BC66|nr:Mu transposase C-terminal domain-containing protein [Bradyrhizobium zhanjiangense]
MMALVNMVSSKVEFCKEYGIVIDEAEWPAHHACKVLLGDKGELSSVGLTELIEAKLRIQIENAASGRADFKSIVERRFGTVPTVWKPFAPGYVESDYGQRGAHDYKLDAKLNIYEFTQLVIYAVLEHNSEPVSGFRMPAGMIADGLNPIPLEIWSWGIENRSGSLRHLPVEEVALAVMPQDTARVTPKGIKFKNAFYECETARREDWFSLARRPRSTWQVDVSYDLRLKQILYLRDARLPRGFEVCTLLPGYEDCVGKTHFEAEELALVQKVQLAAGADRRQEQRIQRDILMREIVGKATKEQELHNDPSISKAKRLSSINDNHAREKAAQRRREANDFASKLSAPVETPHVENETLSSPSSYEAELLAYLKQNDPESPND